MTHTTARGYGAAHQRLRAAWAPKVEAGMVDCWRCELPIRPGETWELGHDDHDRSTYRGPEHFRCNRSAAGIKGAAVVQTKKATTIREW